MNPEFADKNQIEREYDMSERPVEDDIMDEARRFGHSMAALMRKHAQARGWWEQRKVRREISLTMREQRRAEQAERAHHLSWTSQMIHRYQVSAQAGHQRSMNPRISPEDWRRDQAAAGRHLEHLRERVVGNSRLTEIERGIALDCLESARMFPYKETRAPEMLERAGRVRGLDALRYRAQLARETERIQSRYQEHRFEQPERTLSQREPVRPTGELTAAQADAIQGLRRAQLEWNAKSEGADLQGRNRMAEDWRQAARSAQEAGFTPQRIEWEFRNAEENSRYVANVHSLSHPEAASWGHAHSFHPSQAEAADWANRHVRETNWAQGSYLNADVHQRGDHVDPVRSVSGGVGHVAAQTTSWASAPARKREPSRSGSDKEVASLRERHHLSIEHNAELADQNATLTSQLTALRAERDQLATERDRYKTERDESVQQLIQRTPAADRLGSQQRQQQQRQQSEKARASRTGPHRTTRGENPSASVESLMQHHAERREWQQAVANEEHRQMFEAMQQASKDKKSPVIEAKLRELTGLYPDPTEYQTKAGADFSRWWFDGGHQHYTGEKQRRESPEQKRQEHESGADRAQVGTSGGQDSRETGASEQSEKQREPIPGHAFAGLVNGRNREREGVER